MKKKLSALFLLACIAIAFPASAQKPDGKSISILPYEVADGDTVFLAEMHTIPVFRRPADMRRYERLVRNVKAVYPLAKEAGRLLTEVEAELEKMPAKRERRRYINRTEQELISKYTPVLKKMTFSQGKILIKLVDRETQKTTFTIIKEMEGGLNASLWQGFARLFGGNLKNTYDPENNEEDKLIEKIIILYEAGLI